PLHEIDGADVRRFRPPIGGDHSVARVDRDREAVGVTVDEAADELRIVDRRGPDDDARRAGLRESLRGVEVAYAAARLDLDREAIGDRPGGVEFRRLAGARAVEVDDVEPFGSVGDELARGLEG